MPLSQNEKKVVKALKGILSQDLLGLSMHEDAETSHNSQFRWSGLGDAFRLKAAKSPYYDSMCAAFTKIHDYKYIDHPTFKIALESDMKSMGLPTHVIEHAKKIVDELLNEFNDGDKVSERDAGWGDIEGLKDVTSHAHDRKMTNEKPHTGGGPAPEGDRKSHMN